MKAVTDSKVSEPNGAETFPFQKTDHADRHGSTPVSYYFSVGINLRLSLLIDFSSQRQKECEADPFSGHSPAPPPGEGGLYRETAFSRPYVAAPLGGAPLLVALYVRLGRKVRHERIA